MLCAPRLLWRPGGGTFELMSDTETGEVAALALQPSTKQRETPTSHVQAPLQSTHWLLAEPRSNVKKAQKDRLLLQMDLHSRNVRLPQGRETWKAAIVPEDARRSTAERDFGVTIFITVGFCS